MMFDDLEEMEAELRRTRGMRSRESRGTGGQDEKGNEPVGCR